MSQKDKTKQAAQYLQAQGRNGDTMLAHINPIEAEILKAFGGSGTINPNTGLREFGWFSDFISDPIGTISDTVSDVGDALGGLVEGIGDAVGDAVQWVADGVVKIANTVGDVVQNIIDNPEAFLKQLAAQAIATAGQAVGIPYPVTMAAISAFQGQSIEQIAVNMAFQEFAPSISKALPEGMGNYITEFTGSEAATKAITSGLTKGITSGATAMLNGGDFTKGFTSGVVGSVAASASTWFVNEYVAPEVNQQVKDAGYSGTVANTVNNMINRTIASSITANALGADSSKLIASALVDYSINAGFFDKPGTDFSRAGVKAPREFDREIKQQLANATDELTEVYNVSQEYGFDDDTIKELLGAKAQGVDIDDEFLDFFNENIVDLKDLDLDEEQYRELATSFDEYEKSGYRDWEQNNAYNQDLENKKAVLDEVQAKYDEYALLHGGKNPFADQLKQASADFYSTLNKNNEFGYVGNDEIQERIDYLQQDGLSKTEQKEYQKLLALLDNPATEHEALLDRLEAAENKYQDNLALGNTRAAKSNLKEIESIRSALDKTTPQFDLTKTPDETAREELYGYLSSLTEPEPETIPVSDEQEAPPGYYYDFDGTLKPIKQIDIEGVGDQTSDETLGDLVDQQQAEDPFYQPPEYDDTTDLTDTFVDTPTGGGGLDILEPEEPTMPGAEEPTQNQVVDNGNGTFTETYPDGSSVTYDMDGNIVQPEKDLSDLVQEQQEQDPNYVPPTYDDTEDLTDLFGPDKSLGDLVDEQQAEDPFYEPPEYDENEDLNDLFKDDTVPGGGGTTGGGGGTTGGGGGTTGGGGGTTGGGTTGGGGGGLPTGGITAAPSASQSAPWAQFAAMEKQPLFKQDPTDISAFNPLAEATWGPQISTPVPTYMSINQPPQYFDASQMDQQQQFAEGGLVDHNPEFFSEGGASLANRYVKGDGDGTSDSVPAMLASGEFVIPADVVSALGNGDNDAGAGVLDQFLAVIRRHKRDAHENDLPPDSKGPLTYIAEAQKRAKNGRTK